MFNWRISLLHFIKGIDLHAVNIISVCACPGIRIVLEALAEIHRLRYSSNFGPRCGRTVARTT